MTATTVAPPPSIPLDSREHPADATSPPAAPGLSPTEFARLAQLSQTVSLPDLLARPNTLPSYVVDPFVPTRGVTFFYGKKGLGKSPLSWELGLAVALGRPFLGQWATRQGTVLFVELDTPEELVKPRLRLVPSPHPATLHLLFMPPFDVLGQSIEVARLKAAQKLHRPDLIIINTLRKAHLLDGNAGETPSRVYAAFQTMFPDAALWFVHHDKKTSENDSKRDADEAFAGSQAWINDATVGLHLVKKGDRLISLEHTKNQTAPHGDKHMLRLDKDGTQISLHARSQQSQVLAAYAATDATKLKRERVEAVSKSLGDGFSVRTVWRILKSAGQVSEAEASEPDDTQPPTERAPDGDAS